MKLDMPPELSAVVESLRSDLIELYVRWTTYNQLYAFEKDSVEVLNKIAPGFFGLTQILYQDDLVLGIARMTDEPGDAPKLDKKDKRNLSLKLVVKMLDGAAHPKLKDVLQKIIDSNDGDNQPWGKMRELRNKRIAHRHLDAFKVQPELSLDYNHADVKQALDTVTKFLTAINDGWNYGNVILASGDPDCLIRRLRKAIGYQLLEGKGLVPRLNGQSVSTIETMFGPPPSREQDPTPPRAAGGQRSGSARPNDAGVPRQPCRIRSRQR